MTSFQQRYSVLEDQLVELIIESLEHCAEFDRQNSTTVNSNTFTAVTTASDSSSSGVVGAVTPVTASKDYTKQCNCNHVTSLLFSFAVTQQIAFKSLVQSLHDKVSNINR